MCMCVCVCVSFMCTTCIQVPAEALDPLELELQAVVSPLMWVLGIKPESYARALSAPNH